MPNIERQDQFIRSLGVEAYRVGGSVRDEILGRKPKDADYIVRGQSLEALLEILNGQSRKARVSALKDRQDQQFGWRYNGIEIALPRLEADAGNGRAQVIAIDPNLPLSEDAKRRDFTFNALYKQVSDIGDYDLFTVEISGRQTLDIIDPTGRGVEDLIRRMIRTTHSDSFRDDPLRILRALRFMAQGFDITVETAAEVKKHAEHVDGLTVAGHTSGTVFDEFSKMLMGDRPDAALRFARNTGVLAIIMPELAEMLGFEQGSRYHDLTTDEHTFVALHTAAKVEAPLRVRWALLFHDAGKPEAAWCDSKGNHHYYASPRNLLDPNGVLDDETWEFAKTEDHEVVGERLWRAAGKRMNVARELTHDVAVLIREHMIAPVHRAPGVWVRRKRVEMGDTLLRDLLLMRTCDLAGKGAGKVALDQIAHMGDLTRELDTARIAMVPASVKDLAINGHDLKELGYKGREIGEVLARVLDEVVCDPSPRKRERDWQLSRAK